MRIQTVTSNSTELCDYNNPYCRHGGSSCNTVSNQRTLSTLHCSREKGHMGAHIACG